MQEHGPQVAMGGNSCGIDTFLIIHVILLSVLKK